ncbi:hypothetical protein GOODEAATRI_012931 [Goodea atripinnis]|uniref:C2 tensin-type domain-containing protein n=1 Tax=Goodea atripinnis TaxID=208336 RepID=A0ABV0NJS2_9TELE
MRKYYDDKVSALMTPSQKRSQGPCVHQSGARSAPERGHHEREVIFRLQFHTGAVQGYNLMFEKEDMENANKGTPEEQGSTCTS